MGLFLGGAPFNVACHLHRLGEEVAFASRVGDDVLGREARRRMRHQGLSDALVQVDPQWPTGFVEVDLDADGSPAYTIVDPAAWDAVAPTDALRACAEDARALVFGSLAQRKMPARQTIRTLWDTNAVKVFDVNLRPPFEDQEVVEASLAAADIAKLNEEELDVLTAWFDLPTRLEQRIPALADCFACKTVCVTRGASGAVLWNDGNWYEHPGYSVEVNDTVGAGDAFLAALLAGVLAERSDEAVLDDACRLGAYVATCPGSTPSYDEVAAIPVDTLRDRSSGADSMSAISELGSTSGPSAPQ